MTKFWRQAHLRTGPSGSTHWVRGHPVDRDSWEIFDTGHDLWVRGLRWTRARLDAGIPNARCPRCGQPVWFYRNPNGGCAYFDELGVPWPKHPCMDTRSVEDRSAVWQARAVYREVYELNDQDAELEEAQDAYQQWQEARDEFYRRAGERAAAERERDSAFCQVLTPGDTSVVVREQRERWVRAREDFVRAEAAYLESQELVKTTLQEYIRVLTEYF